MRTALGASSLLLLAIAAGCGSGGPANDHDAITELWSDFFDALASGDAGGAVSLYPDSCDGGDVERQLETIFTAIGRVSDDIEYDVTDVELQNLTGTSAESIPVGTYMFGDLEQPIDSDGYTEVLKEGGRWKFATCQVIGETGIFDEGGGQ